MNQTINPSGWPRPSGYANAILAQGRYLAMSGQIGWNERNELVGNDFLAQARQALENVMTILRAAGGAGEHLVRLTWYITDKAEYRQTLRALGDAYREIVGPHYPAMALVQVAALLEEGAKVEIEATAVLPAAPAQEPARSL
ncbi:MAG: RidA family protein [Candidatus Eremiobacteraeota bacterium]|nr:RidA family protein [Candidatus Eremiobacteraeota bacterium]